MDLRLRWLAARLRPVFRGSLGHATARLTRARKLLIVLAWAYLAAVLAAWVAIGAGADRWWVATLAMFGPRWLGLLPLAALIPAALWLRRRSLAVLLAGAGIVLIPIMGFCLPWRAGVHRGAAGRPLRILTCNIHRYALDITALRNLLDDSHPDIVLLQEWSSRYDPLFADKSWHVHRTDELLIASRYPILRIEDVGQGRWGSAGSAACYEVAAPQGTLHILNVHLASPHPALEAVIDRSPDAADQVRANSALRLDQSAFLSRRAGKIAGPVLIAGDFNTPCESTLFDRCWSAMTDAFTYAGFGFGYTYYSGHNAVRIDHVLFNGFWTCGRCEVGPDVGSPHRPVLAELRMTRRK